MTKIHDLDALTNADRLPQVRLFGRAMAVRPLAGGAAHRIAVAQSVEDSGEAMLAALLGVVRSSCPDLTAEEREALSVEQITAIVQLSRGMISAVEASLTETEEKN